MKKYYNLKAANAYSNFEFAEWKSEIFDFVKDNFNPSRTNGTVDYYTFYISKTRWKVRYDRDIKCWMIFVDDELIINKYDEPSKIYINDRGFVCEWQYFQAKDERFEKVLYDESRQLMSQLRAVQIEQEDGTRKIDFPKEKQHGRISRKDFYAGMDDEWRKTYWALKFSVDDIKYIDKEPVIAPLTLREYFRLCRIYYLANQGYYIKDVPDDPKEAYMRFADGRTDQLDEVDLDDPQDLYDWKMGRGRWTNRYQGGHPSEIFAKTYLYPYFTDGLKGYYLWSGFIWNYDEVVTFCREPNVMLSKKEHLVEIIKGSGYLEVTPSYNHYGYPNDRFQEPERYENLTRKQKNKVLWDELTEAKRKK